MTVSCFPFHICKKAFSRPLLLIVFYYLPFPCSAQLPPDLKFSHISKEQGLSNSTVLSIVQDNEGFIWLGTPDGLNKYDGYQVSSFLFNPKDSTSISSSNITALLEDSQRNLWIGTGNGLNKYNKKTNSFTRYINKPEENSSLNNNDITTIYQDRQDNVWLGTSAGLHLLDESSHSFPLYKLSGKFNITHVSCLFEDKKGNFWIGTDGNGLILYNFKTKASINYMNTADDKSIGSNYISAIKETPTGNLIIGTKDAGIDVFDPTKGSFTHFRYDEKNPSSIGNNTVKAVFVDKKGRIWIAVVNGGLNLWDQSTGKFFHYKNNPSQPLSFSQKTASAIFEDRQGNLWIGTHRGGVNLYSTHANKFTTYTQGTDPSSMSYKDIRAFYEADDGKIWVGSDGGGINLWNRQKNIFTQFRHNPNNPASVGSDAILHIYKDKEQRLWIGTWDGGLNLYNPANGSFKRFFHNRKEEVFTSNDNAWQIFEDSKNNLWVGTFYGGLNLFDTKTEKFSHIVYDNQHKTQFWGNKCLTITEDKIGNLWFGTQDSGLNCLNAKTRQFEHYFTNEKGDQVANMVINDVFIDSKQRLWVGKKGLYVFDYNTKKFLLYSQNPVLADESILSILEDKKGNLWIATAGKGLIMLNPETKSLRFFTDADALQGMEFNPNTAFKTSKGEMLFGGYKGFTIFNPDSLEEGQSSSSVYITDLQVFNKSALYAPTIVRTRDESGQPKEIVLDYKQSMFSLEYAALNYASPKETEYAYKLDNFDNDWNYVGTQRKATFTNLDPGTYVFHVKARTTDGEWTDQSASVKIVVTPAFWMTWWFKTLVVLVILGITFTILFYRRKFKLEKIDEQKAKELQQLQLQFFTNISHEFRTPLSLIAAPLEKIQKTDPLVANRPYYQIMQRNINRLMALISELMDFRKVETGVLKLKVMQGNINAVIKGVADDFKELALEKNITFSIQLNETIINTWFDHQTVEKIIINLIHNAFKYTGNGGAITVRTSDSLRSFPPSFKNELLIKNEYRSSRYTYILISDTGIGISKESIQYLFERYYRITQHHLGSGVGLAFVKSLALLHKGEIYVYSEKDKGTEIVVALPMDKEDYKKEERWLEDEPGTVQLESMRYSRNPESTQIETDRNLTEGKTDTQQLTKHILLVDDNEELRFLLKESLSGLYHIEEAGNGIEALEKIKETSPDLVISDVMMPVMDGIEFCKQLKKDIEISHIPFILLTAKDALQSKLDGISSGADHYFGKPVNTDLLLLTIRNLFAQRQKIKERYATDYKVEIKELVHTAKDKEFMDSLLTLIDTELENSELGVDSLAQSTGMNRTKLNKKIKDITGLSINEFVRSYRLKKSVDIMTHEDVTITEVMYRVGIQSNSYFTTAFKKEFGKTPSQFLQEIKKPKLQS